MSPSLRKLRFDLRREAVGDDYRALLRALCDISSRALLVERDHDWLGADGKRIQRLLQPHLIRIRRQAQWPGTQLLCGAQTEVYYYRFDRHNLDLFSSAVSGLYGWLGPDAPEDLALLRDDESAALMSIAHEHDASVYLTHAESESLSQRYAWWSPLLARLRLAPETATEPDEDSL